MHREDDPARETQDHRAEKPASLTRAEETDLRVDLETRLEILLFQGGLASMAAGLLVLFALLVEAPPFLLPAGLTLLALGVALLVLRKITDCSYFINKASRQVEYRAAVGPLEVGWTTCTFDQVAAITSRGRYRRGRIRGWWEYQTVLVLRSRKIIAISDYLYDGLANADGKAVSLAGILDVDQVPGKEKTKLVVRSAPGGEVKIEHLGGWRLFFGGGFGWVTYLVYLLAMLAALGAVVSIFRPNILRGFPSLMERNRDR